MPKVRLYSGEAISVYSAFLITDTVRIACGMVSAVVFVRLSNVYPTLLL